MIIHNFWHKSLWTVHNDHRYLHTWSFRFMSTTLHIEWHFSFLNLCLMLISWCLGVKTDFINFNPHWYSIWCYWLMKKSLGFDELINFFKVQILQDFSLFSLVINSWWLWDILQLNKPFKWLLLWLMFCQNSICIIAAICWWQVEYKTL